MSALSVDLAAVHAPTGTARGLPSALYTSEAAFALERERIFHGGWACLGFGKDVPDVGNAVPLNFFGAPLLMLRDTTGAVKVYENVCRHRGMILVEEPRTFGGVIRCPYHSWCYSLDGKLRATPHVGGPGINTHAELDPKETGLTPIRSAVWMDCVFVDVSGKAPAFEDWIAPLAARWADFADRPLHHGGPESGFTLDVNCNWKLAIENYCESYHLPWVHPGLNAYSRLEDHYHIEARGAYSGQGTVVYNPQFEAGAFPNFPDLPKRWDTAAEYVSLFPNLMLGIHRDHLFALKLDPQAPGRTIEHIEIWYATEAAARDPGFQPLRDANAAQWKEVFTEDIFVVEGMQRGRHAPHFDGGRFSAVMDNPTHLFHEWVADRLA
ncbi:MAG: aromatic ring-hydroxylating dioxygenase subunit alpha [Pseudomonadota bacterium]